MFGDRALRLEQLYIAVVVYLKKYLSIVIMPSVTIMANVTIMRSTIYVKCYLWQMYYGDECNNGKPIMYVVWQMSLSRMINI